MPSLKQSVYRATHRQYAFCGIIIEWLFLLVCEWSFSLDPYWLITLGSKWLLSLDANTLFIPSEVYKGSNFVIKRNNRVLYDDCTNKELGCVTYIVQKSIDSPDCSGQPGGYFIYRLGLYICI